MKLISGMLSGFGCVLISAALLPACFAQEKDSDGKPPAKLIPLNAKKTVLLDKANNRLLLKTKIVLRSGTLEMFCCPTKAGKEHESIVSVDSRAVNVHAGLLALGLKPGTPAKFVPKFVPPTGPELQIFVRWKDKAGKEHRVDARSWVRYAVNRYFVAKLEKLPPGFKLPDEEKSELRYDERTKELLWYGHMTKAQRDELLKLSADKKYRSAIESFFKQTQVRQMDSRWVFAGSFFAPHPTTGKKIYVAEQGTLICVANFPGATVDVASKSSASAGSELFEAFTERIPPLETEVTVEITPVKKGSKAKTGNSR